MTWISESKTWISFGAVVIIVGASLWLSAIYWKAERNESDIAEIVKLTSEQSVRIDSTRDQIESVRTEMRDLFATLATKDDVDAKVRAAIAEQLLGVYRQLGELKGSVDIIQRQMPQERKP